MPSTSTIPPCRHCALAQARFLSRCPYCGTAVRIGREPSEREQHETSRAAIEDRQVEIAEARRTKDEYDRVLIAALHTHVSPTGEFTHDYIARLSGLNTSACQFALRRLQKKGIVRITGAVNVRSNRKIPQWQYLLPTQAIAADAKGSGGLTRNPCAPTRGRGRRSATAGSAQGIGSLGQ